MTTTMTTPPVEKKRDDDECCVRLAERHGRKLDVETLDRVLKIAVALKKKEEKVAPDDSRFHF